MLLYLLAFFHIFCLMSEAKTVQLSGLAVRCGGDAGACRRILGGTLVRAANRNS